MDMGGRIFCDHYVGLPAVHYTLEECPRCMGTGYYGGFEPSDKGDIPLVEGADYLKQALEKVFTESMRSTGYGFNYDLLRGLGDQETLKAIKREVRRCVMYLANRQQEDKKDGTLYATNEEIYDVRDIVVDFDSAEPRKLILSLTVIAASGRNIDLTTVLMR